jgi:hypothetical protein
MPATTAVPEEFALPIDRFAAPTDTRRARGKGHPLPGALALVVLGPLAGCRSLRAMSRDGTIPPGILPPLGPRRRPAVATLHRLRGVVTVTEVRGVMRASAQDPIARRGVAEAVPGVALAGKTPRGTPEDGTDGHVLRAFARPAMPALARAPAPPAWRGDRRHDLGDRPRRTPSGVGDLDGRCGGCRAIAVRGGGRRATRLGVSPQTNHPAPFADAATLFADPGPPAVVTTEKGHGRIERREPRARAEPVGSSAFPGWARVAELQAGGRRRGRRRRDHPHRPLFGDEPGTGGGRPGPVAGAGAAAVGDREPPVPRRRRPFRRGSAGAAGPRPGAGAGAAARGGPQSAPWPVRSGGQGAPLTARAGWVNGHPLPLLTALS